MSALAISNVVLWVLVLVLAAVLLAVVRQLGVLHERIAPAGALMLNRGLTVGEAAPVVRVTDLQGAAHEVGAARADGRSTLVLFVSPTCPVCKTLLPAVKSSRKDERGWMDVMLASDGDQERRKQAGGRLAALAAAHLGAVCRSTWPTAASSSWPMASDRSRGSATTPRRAWVGACSSASFPSGSSG